MFFSKRIFKISRLSGKLRIFFCFGGGEPSLALGGFPNANFASDENTSHVCPDLAQESARLSLLLAISTAYGRKVTLMAMAKARSGKNDLSNCKILIINAPHNAKHGRAFNETGTAGLRRRVAHRAGASSGTTVG